MALMLSRQAQPPRHAIQNETCWHWGWKLYKLGIQGYCDCPPPSRREILLHILVNYVAKDPKDRCFGGVMDQNWRNWSLVCAEWADVLRQTRFEHRRLSFDSDMDDILFTLQLQARDPGKFTSFVWYVKNRALYARTPPSWDDPKLSRLQTIGGYGWLHIKAHSWTHTIPHHHYAPATAASLPPEIWTTVGGYVDGVKEARNLSLVCVDWARGCRTQVHEWVVCIRSRKNMELFLQFTKRETRFPRLVDFISWIRIYQDPSSPLWFDRLSRIRSDPVLARRLQPASDRNRPALEINLWLVGDRHDIKPLHPSIGSSLPWSISASPQYDLIWIEDVRLRSFRELRHIASAAQSSTNIRFQCVTWDAAKVLPLPNQLCVIPPGVQTPYIAAESCTSNILVALAAFSSISSSQSLHHKSAYRSVPLNRDDQDIICTLVTNILKNESSLCLPSSGYDDCAFSCLFRICSNANLSFTVFSSQTLTGSPVGSICAVYIQFPYFLPSEDDACTNMFQTWALSLPAILDLPMLRTVIFHADKRSRLPGLLEHVVDVIGAPPAAGTFRYVYGHGYYDNNSPVYEVTRHGKPLNPPKEWKTEKYMLRDIIQ